MRCFAYAALLIALAGATAQGSIIDDFSSDSISLYNPVLRYNGGGGAGSYGIADGQFAPTGGTGGTTDWLRNDGPVFKVGDTITLDVDALNSQGSCIGLALCQSLTFADSSNEREFYVTASSSGNKIYTGTAEQLVADMADPTTATPVTVALTRTSDTGLSYAYLYTKTGGGQGSATGTCSGLPTGDLYFGLCVYSGMAFNGTAMDNLSHTTSTPEPSTLVLIVGGLIGLLAYAWRKQR